MTTQQPSEIGAPDEVERALTLLVHASRVSPPLREAVAVVEEAIRGRKWSDPDMYEAWAAGAQWAIDGVEIEDGELYVPLDDAGVEGRDWAEAFGSWISDYETEGADDAAP